MKVTVITSRNNFLLSKYNFVKQLQCKSSGIKIQFIRSLWHYIYLSEYSSTAGKGKKILELQLPECSQYISKDFTFLHAPDSSWLLFLPLRGGKFETESCIVCLCVRAGTGSSSNCAVGSGRSGEYHHQSLKTQYLTGLDQKFDSVVQTSTGIWQALRHPKHPEGMPDMTLHEGYDQVIHCSHLDKETIQRWGL